LVKLLSLKEWYTLILKNMDFLQIALIFLIILLGVFLSITGIQVFLILKDLKKTLDNINELVSREDTKEKITTAIQKSSKPQNSRRLFKNVR